MQSNWQCFEHKTNECNTIDWNKKTASTKRAFMDKENSSQQIALLAMHAHVLLMFKVEIHMFKENWNTHWIRWNRSQLSHASIQVHWLGKAKCKTVFANVQINWYWHGTHAIETDSGWSIQSVLFAASLSTRFKSYHDIPRMQRWQFNRKRNTNITSSNTSIRIQINSQNWCLCQVTGSSNSKLFTIVCLCVCDLFFDVACSQFTFTTTNWIL